MRIVVHSKAALKFFILALTLSFAGNVLAQPVADFSANTRSGCAPLLIQFNDLSSANPTSWKWDLGNGTNANIQNPSVTYFTPGRYKVTLIAKNASGSDTLVKEEYIIVQLPPAVSFVGTPTSGCLPLAVQFTDQSTAGSGTLSTWQWDFGDGFTSSLKNPQHTYTTSGTFDVTLQVKNSFGCGSTASTSKYINTGNNVIARFSNDFQNNCKPPITLNFQNQSAGPASTTYQWSFGDGSVSTNVNPSHTYLTAGNFMVKLIAESGGIACADTTQKEIVIGTVTSGFVSPAAVCAKVPFSLVNTSEPVPSGVLWDFGDGTSSDSLNPSKTYPAPGSYTIKLLADFGACRDSVSKPVTVLSNQNIVFTVSDTTSCKAPFSVNFTSNVPGATSFSWNFGDGTGSQSANPTHIYNVAGNYDVSLAVTNTAGCRDTLKKVKYISIRAVAVSLPYLPLKNCVPFTYTFTSVITTTDPVLSYTWDFGDGATDTAKSPSHTFTAVGSYAITLTTLTSQGCSTITKISNGVIVGNKPVANFSASPLVACANVPINFSDLSTGNVNEWLWDFGDKASSTTKSPVHTYQDTGYYNVKLLVRSSGCPDTISFQNYVYIKPAVSKFVVKTSCTFPLQKTFVDSSRGADSWQWNFGDGSALSPLQNPLHIYADTGTYTVTLKVINLSTGCEHTSTKNVQVIREKAMFTAADTTLCRGNSVELKSTNSPSKIAGFAWTFGDGTPAQNARDIVAHKYSVFGNFSVRLIIIDVLGCRDTLVRPAYVNVSGPTAKFSSIQNACANTNVVFNDSSVISGLYPIIKWTWAYGDNTTDVLSATPFTHTYTAKGTYSVRLKVTDSNGCEDSVLKANYLVISKPVARFAARDTITCPLAPVQFIGSSEGSKLTYLWRFGDGTTSVDANPVHQYATTDSFTVSLKVTDQFGCTDSIRKVKYVVVILPKAGFTLNDSVSACPPFFVTFTNTSSNYNTLQWDFGDGNFSSSVNPTHFYYIPGTYIVKLKVTGPGGCSDEKSNTIVVKGPNGVLSYTNIVGCNSLTTNFKASAKDNILFIWDFNDGTTVQTNDSSISHTYVDTGFYLPKLVLEDANGCQVPILGIDTIEVIGVQANFNALTKVLCDAGDVFFKDSSSGNEIINNWLWNFGDGITSMEQNPVHHYTSPGFYSVREIVITANGCRDTIQKNEYVSIVARPDITIQSSNNRCAFDTLIFKGVSSQTGTSVIAWQWDFKNGQTAAIQDPPSQRFSLAANYLVTAIATNSSGCRDTATALITINPLPAVDAGDDAFLCLGSPLTLQASGAGTYQWIEPINFLSCTNCSNPVTNTPADITYNVKGTNAFGCVAFDSVHISVKKPFTLTVTPAGDSLCLGQSIQLNASLADNYLWTPAKGLNNNSVSNPVAAPDITTIYKVVAFDNASCFKDSAFVNITVFKNPVVEAGGDKTAKAGASVLLSPVYSADVTNWLWTPTAGLNCNTCPAPVARPGITTTYSINVKNNGGCTAADNITVFTTCTSENVFMPNTFSPNGDGVNDIFYPRGTGLNRIRGLRIFNRWGQVVFERSNFYANDPSSGWNGSLGGKKVSADVYTFIMEIICDNNDVITENGNITLIN